MTVFVYIGLTRNLEIGNTPVGVLCNISRDWGKLCMPNLTQMSLIKSYKARVTAFIGLQRLLTDIERKPAGDLGKNTTPTQVRVNMTF